MNIDFYGNSCPITKLDIQLIQQHLIKNRPFWHYVFFETGINTGFKPFELLQLRYSHFLKEDLSPLEYIGFHGSSNPFEPLPLSPNLYQLVHDLFLDKTGSVFPVSIEEYIFVSRSGNHKMDKPPIATETASRLIKDIVKHLELNPQYTLSSLRSTYYKEYWGFFDRNAVLQRHNSIFL